MACGAPFDADALYEEVRSAAPYRASDAATDFDARRRFRRHRRLCAQALRPLCAAAQNAGRAVAPRPSAPGAAISAECRRDRRRPDGRHPASIARAGRPARAGACWASWRNISSSNLSPGDTFVFAGDVLRFEGMRENAAYVTAHQRSGSARCPATMAANFRFRPFSPSACARWCPSPEQLACAARSGAANGCRSRNGARVIPKPGQLLVETFPRGSRRIISSAIRSRDGWRIRRWACC